MFNREDGSRVRMRDGAVEEELTARQAACEDLLLGMRMSRGVAAVAIEAARGLIPNINSTFERLAGEGLVREHEGRIVPTERGWLMGDRIAGAIWELAE
jgi:oxygen-independent coproporphyrinogen-3 oxidase